MHARHRRNRGQTTIRALAGLTLVLALLAWTAAQVAREHDGETVVLDYRAPEARAALMVGEPVESGGTTSAMVNPDIGDPIHADLDDASATSWAEWGASLR
jgi:hypothetical protein